MALYVFGEPTAAIEHIPINSSHYVVVATTAHIGTGDGDGDESTANE